jgi:hypothetical protein
MPSPLKPASSTAFSVLGLAFLLLTAGEAHAINEASRPFTFRFAACRDQDVGRYIGQDKSVALGEMRTAHFRAFRLVSYKSLVNYEVEPDRLTLVVNDDGQVIRAFCR